MKLRALAILAVTGLLLGLALPVLAHAQLLRSIPDANASLPRSPTQIEIYFSESVESSFSSISVFDTNGIQMDNIDSRVDSLDPTHLIVSVRSLPDGVYTASWKVLSTVDGHVTLGAFPFAVGTVDARDLATADQASKQITLSLGEVAARWLTFLAGTALAGGTLFVLVVWQPAYQASTAQFGKASFSAPWRRLAAIALIIFILANVLALLIQVGKVEGREIAAPWSGATVGILFYTRFGIIWLARLMLTFALAGLLSEADAPRDRWIGFGLALLLLLTISLNSHAAAQPQPYLPVAMDWLHLMGASVWVGGLTHFVAGMWAARQSDPPFRTRLTARLIPRFSILALGSVGLLALTGLYAAVEQIGSFDALFNTLYGRTLLIKSLIALPMLGLGAFNLLRITPALRKAVENRGNDALVARFRNIITSELSLGVVLLLSVGVLTAIPPARTSATAPEIRRTATVEDLQLDLSITPGRVGVNTFVLTLGSNGHPVTDAKEVLLRFTPLSGKLPASETTLTTDGNGQYTLKASNLSLPDNWQVQAVVRRENQFDAYTNFEVSLTPSASSGSFAWYRVAGGLLLAGALLYLFAFSTLGQTQRQLIGFGIIPALALAILSVVVFYREPTPAPTGIVNPIPPNSDSIAKGQTLYTTNCLPCHGLSGKGDGPVGLTLSPRPADLTLHTAPGVHEDGQLWLWISDGFPGSVMPAFRGALPDEQRWHLVNYIRTLNK